MPIRPGWMATALAAAALCGCPTTEPADPLTATVVTFNTGTTEGIVPAGEPNGGYGEEQATWSDQWYGDGLAFEVVIADAQAFFERADPDVVYFDHKPLVCDVAEPQSAM